MKKPITNQQAPYLREFLLNRDRVLSFSSYPFSLPAVCGLKSVKLHPKATFFVGENGSGKSTLLEAIAVAYGLNAEGGSRNFNFSTRSSHSALAEYLTIVKYPNRPKDSFFLRAESYFNLATEIENLDGGAEGGIPIIDAYGGTSLHEQSHGESFFSLFLNRLRGDGVYILDEPEAALSPMRQLALVARMHQLILKESQFVIATHSPILMSYPDAFVYEVSANGLKKVDYKETEHFAVSQAFFSNPETMLEILTEDQ